MEDAASSSSGGWMDEDGEEETEGEGDGMDMAMAVMWRTRQTTEHRV